MTHAVKPQRASPAKPIDRRKHLRPRIGRQPLDQLVKRAGHKTDHFLVYDGVNAGGIRLCQGILPLRDAGDFRLTGLVVSRRI